MKRIHYLTILLIIIAICCSSPKSKQPVQSEEIDTSSLVKLEITIQGMSCHGCAQTIQGAISELPGVKSAEASYSFKNAVVEFNPEITDTAAIYEAIEQAGYLPLHLSNNLIDSLAI